MFGNCYYSKSKPKVDDYNPLTHSSFYNLNHKKTQSVDWRFKDIKKSSEINQTTFVKTGARQVTPAFLKVERRYKSKPRTEIFNPIVGTRHKYSRNLVSDNSNNVNIKEMPYNFNDKIGGVRKMPIRTSYISPISLMHTDEYKYDQSAAKFYA